MVSRVSAPNPQEKRFAALHAGPGKCRRTCRSSDSVEELLHGAAYGATLTNQPVSVKQLALDLPSFAWKKVGWLPGNRGLLRSGFAAVWVRPAHRDEKRIEASEPTKLRAAKSPQGFRPRGSPSTPRAA